MSGRPSGMEPWSFFVVWNTALYLSALAYVYDASGQPAAAMGTVLLVAAVLVPVFHPSNRQS